MFEVYLLKLQNLEWQKISALSYPACDVKWSPDGSYLAVTVEGKGQDDFTYILPVNEGEPWVIADAQGPICAKQVSWSP